MLQTFVKFQNIGIFCIRKLVPLYITVGSKIIRAFEIIRVKKLMSNAILWNKYFSNHDL